MVSLTAINHRMRQLTCYGSLVLAPLRVCQTVWEQEGARWSHLQHMTFSPVIGTPEQRIRGLLRKADVYLMNYENISWLVETMERLFLSKGQYLPFNMVVFDELTKLKNHTAFRHWDQRRILPYIK